MEQFSSLNVGKPVPQHSGKNVSTQIKQNSPIEPDRPRSVSEFPHVLVDLSDFSDDKKVGNVSAEERVAECMLFGEIAACVDSGVITKDDLIKITGTDSAWMALSNNVGDKAYGIKRLLAIICFIQSPIRNKEVTVDGLLAMSREDVCILVNNFANDETTCKGRVSTAGDVITSDGLLEFSQEKFERFVDVRANPEMTHEDRVEAYGHIFGGRKSADEPKSA